MTQGADPVALEAAARSLFADKIAADVVERLDAAGIPVILLKGPAIGDLIDDPARTYVDCDLLVPADGFEGAEAVLADMGFTVIAMDIFRHDYLRPAHTWVRGDGAEVDLHRTFVGAGVDPTDVFRILSTHTETMVVAGRAMQVLDRPARLCLVTLHAAKDGVRVGRPLRDLERALRRLPADLWEEAAAVAREIGAVSAFAVGLRLTYKGERLAREMGLARTAETGALIRAEGAPPLAVGLDWFVRQRSLPRRVSLAVQKTFPPPRFMRAWSPLARRGGLGLVIAYLWRPVWLALHIPRAVLVWRRASRSGERSMVVRGSDAIVDRIPLRRKAAIVGRVLRSFALVRSRLRHRSLPEVVASLRDSPAVPYRVDPRRLGRLTVRLLRVGDRHARCLFNSLVLFRLLIEQGDSPELVIGMPSSPDDVDAHAWVELNGIDVGPPPGRGVHQDLARYS